MNQQDKQKMITYLRFLENWKHEPGSNVSEATKIYYSLIKRARLNVLKRVKIFVNKM